MILPRLLNQTGVTLLLKFYKFAKIFSVNFEQSCNLGPIFLPKNVKNLAFLYMYLTTTDPL